MCKTCMHKTRIYWPWEGDRIPYKKTRIWLAKGFLWPLKTQKGEPLRARLKYKRENMLFSYAY